jgi:hypothetical protein
MKPILFILPLFICSAASAQLEKGAWNISTSTNAPFNLKLESNGRYHSKSFNFTPNVGYMLKNRWEIGGGPVLSFSKARFLDVVGTPSYESHSSSYGLNLYTRYYFKSSGKLVPYLITGIQYMKTSTGTTDFSGIKTNSRYSEWQVYTGAGVNWFIAPRAALFSELTYTGRWGGGNGFTSGLNLNIGFRYFFGRKKDHK